MSWVYSEGFMSHTPQEDTALEEKACYTSLPLQLQKQGHLRYHDCSPSHGSLDFSLTTFRVNTEMIGEKKVRWSSVLTFLSQRSRIMFWADRPVQLQRGLHLAKNVSSQWDDLALPGQPRVGSFQTVVSRGMHWLPFFDHLPHPDIIPHMMLGGPCFPKDN